MTLWLCSRNNAKRNDKLQLCRLLPVKEPIMKLFPSFALHSTKHKLLSAFCLVLLAAQVTLPSFAQKLPDTSQAMPLTTQPSVGGVPKIPSATALTQCGPAAGGMFASPPASNLCVLGSAVTVPVAALGATQYQWTCGSPPPPTGVLTMPLLLPPSVCTANKKYNGQCGSASGVASSAIPAVNLCALGTATTPTLTGANYTWSCTGILPATGATVASCTAPAPAPSIVQAVSETITVTVGMQGSVNVHANDTAPAGSVYNLAAGSTCSPVSMSALGVVSYTAPAAGQSCVVNYTVCNLGRCSTASLTVTSGSVPTSSSTPTLTVSIVQAVSETITVTAGTQGTNNVRANDTAPSGSVYNLAAGSTCSPVSISALGVVSYTAPAAGQSCVVNYTVCNSGQCSTASLTLVSSSSSFTGSSAVTTISTTFTTSTKSRFSLVAKASGGFYDVTECVKDNVTRLIWEGKTASGVRAGGNVYHNHDDVNQVQYGSDGFGNANLNPTVAQVNAAYNSVGYKNMVNGSNLCGSGGWRMPTLAELQVLYTASGGNGSNTFTMWLPNTANWTWSSTPYVGNAAYSFGSVHFLDFTNGASGIQNRLANNFVRLVRAN